MDRRLFLLAAAGAMLPGCASIGGDSGPPASAPVYRVGDRWTYSGKDGYRQPVTWVETHEVVAVDAQGIAIRVTQKGPSVDTTRIERLSAPGIVTEGALFDSETRRFKTPLTRYRFPLTPGTHWNQFIDNFDESTQQDGQINNYMSVRRWEKVKVPAGEFDAIVLRDFSRQRGRSCARTRSRRTAKKTRGSLPSSTRARTPCSSFCPSSARADQAGRPRARRSAAVRGFFWALRSAAPSAGRSHSRIASGPSTASSGAR